MSKPISENFSEKPKRGRPRRFRELPDYIGTCLTVRGKQNHAYAMRAMVVLNNTPHNHLWNTEKIRDGTGKVKLTILAELGRFPDPDAMRKAAAFVCRLRMKTADAIDFLRKGRGVRRDGPA